jgi:hypothetical protein
MCQAGVGLAAFGHDAFEAAHGHAPPGLAGETVVEVPVAGQFPDPVALAFEQPYRVQPCVLVAVEQDLGHDAGVVVAAAAGAEGVDAVVGERVQGGRDLRVDLVPGNVHASSVTSRPRCVRLLRADPAGRFIRGTPPLAGPWFRTCPRGPASFCQARRAHGCWTASLLRRRLQAPLFRGSRGPAHVTVPAVGLAAESVNFAPVSPEAPSSPPGGFPLPVTLCYTVYSVRATSTSGPPGAPGHPTAGGFAMVLR